jgi:DNA-binding transcriptional LysR family regulator
MTDSYSPRTPQQALAALLDLHAPKRLLLIGAQMFPALQAFQEAHPDTELSLAAPGPLPSELAAQRFDLALVVDCLEHISKRQGLELLGGIRNLNASRIAVLADLHAAQWQTTDFYSLALQLSERFKRDDQVLTLFTYDLREYKQVPDWLNARFWANPENFGKYWW